MHRFPRHIALQAQPYLCSVYFGSAPSWGPLILWSRLDYAPEMTWMGMPLFVDLVYYRLLIAVMPVLAGAVTMVLTDKYFGTSFLQPAVVGSGLIPAYFGFWPS